ncbi:hypothetical protein A2803_04060 [Candidatus Woesebacteria bacterium RIFCSPHIGHO2_01_FULL_44_21]|uniref:Diaminopimelate epimerase n=1 Tax=Candidatus Woesebacteria bacterium RIFCSPHIGHO2_01_FULL_44_21 TaxID=1802503 RepID=A0A1F7YYN4_9BACT|nr:MAG: hypothetical protein A2803_04060 [Candidatus Woesebacteria bacterium RIFCSPHIGHO2_01_FULL_44_21]OGM69475.1 MAG: hypothetical protein A2897_03930 [Candidatus Woesebacteria bacterium RIFCSPLOWO2_01_FULL_44_24b]
MKYEKYIIAGGNSTLLVRNCSADLRGLVCKKYLGEVEQVGFVDEFKGLPRLIMMGNELCVNGTIAFVRSLKNKSGFLYTSGVERPVEYVNINGDTSIKLSLPFYIKDRCVIFKGIGYLFADRDSLDSSETLAKMAEEYNLPAFGIVDYNSGRLRPIVYVKATNTIVEETSCGSGSIAMSIISRMKDIVQPTGEIISVEKNNNVFTITAKVEKVNNAVLMESENYLYD